MAIIMRNGLEADFDPNKMRAGELAIVTDARELHATFAPGDSPKVLLDGEAVPNPETAGTEGQVLALDENGDPEWKSVAAPSDAQVEAAVTDWLDEHPEATTTVEDGAITYAKLDSNLKGTVDDVGELKSDITQFSENVLKYPFSETSKTVNGITWTDNGDGTVTANGTATANSTFVLSGWTILQGSTRIDPDTTYVISGSPEGTSLSKYFVACRAYEEGIVPSVSAGTIIRDLGDGADISGYRYVSVYAVVIKNATVSNLVFKPMVCYKIFKNNEFKKYDVNGLFPKVLRQISEDANEEIDRFNDYFDVNLLNLSIEGQTKKNGLTVTVDSNGVLVSGTASANTDFVVGEFTVPQTGSYKVNGQQAVQNLKDYAYVTINNGSTTVLTVKNVTSTTTFDEGVTYTYIIHIASGTVCGEGLLFSPLMVHDSTLFPPNEPRYGDDALMAFAERVNSDLIRSTSSCYIEDYDDVLDQSNGVFPYVVNGGELVVKAPIAIPSGEKGSIIFGNISLNNGQSYKISFDYANTSTKKVYLTFVGLKAENAVLSSVYNMAIPAQMDGHFEATAIWREQYKYFRLYYADFSSGSQCSIANLKIERQSEELNNSIASYLGQDNYISNPVFNEVGVADPTVINADNLYRMFCTSGGAPRMLTSYDLINWTNSGNIGHPALLTTIREIVNPSGSNTVGAWAPNIIKHNGKYIMYYSAIENGNSANNCHMVALVANNPGGRWEFAAELFDANTFGIKDCIDAEVVELADGSMYMFFGSTYGVYLVRLNNDGLSLDTTQTPVLIHAHSASDAIDTKIEGISIHFRQQVSVGYYYYLFASVGNYAKGTGSSNYKLTVARSSELEGPYLDKEGNAITAAANTGTVLLTGTSSLQSPGHCSQIIHDKSGRDYILLHAYTQDSANRSICLAEIKWGNDGWPYVDNNVIHDFVEKPIV